MEYNVSFKYKNSKAADQLQTTQITIENKEKGKGLSSLIKGQYVYGTVVSVKEGITLNFDGQEVTASKEACKDASAGEVKLFEVLKATDKEIELKVVDNTFKTMYKAFEASVRLDRDQDTLEEQKKQSSKRTEKEKEYQKTKSKMDQIVSRLTERDYQLLEKEGFAVEDFTIEGLYAALNRVKAKETDAGKNRTEQQKNSYTGKEISDRLKSENLPTTTENIQKVTTALELSGITTSMNDRTDKYLIAHEMEPTIENIYKAYYSGDDNKQGKTIMLSQEEWRELQPQAEEVIEAAGYEVNEENRNEAKWLIENKLPLTKQTITYKKELEEIKENTNKEVALDKIMEGMKYGISPKDISLLQEQGKSYEQLISQIQTISEEAVTRAVENDSEITIKKLLEEQLKVSGNPDSKEADRRAIDSNVTDTKAVDANIADTKAAEMKTSDTEPVVNEEDAKSDAARSEDKDNSYETIKALRQLEEIRLKMTTQALATMEKKGLHIETERLEKVVETLKEMEEIYYKELLSEAEVEASSQNIQTLRETMQSTSKLRFVPSFVLGITLQDRKLQTIPGLLTEGSKLQKDMEKAGEAYETLMTVPNREYGDSIQKAFKNIEPLLLEMDMENTELNQRAVRILGYNRMDITKEAINQVKAYDLEVTNLIQNLQPAVTVRLIKEGINPLDMPIRELNQNIDKIKEEQGITSEEKFSTYLRKLEKEEGITSEERKTYIGIYRLLYNIEKTDGAALGAVMKADREVTLNSLLTAIRTDSKGNINSIINDEFGTLQSLSRKGETITEQINTAFTADETSIDNTKLAVKPDSVTEQMEFLDRMLRIMKEEISPDKLSSVRQGILQAEQLAGQSILEVIPIQSPGKGIWETIADIPIEKLYDQLQKAEETQITEKAEYEEKVQEIRELCKNADQAIRFLNDYKIPSTSANILMANHILSNGEVPLKKLFKQQREKTVESSENSLMEIDKLSDTLIDKSSMKEAYEKLEDDAKASLDQACSEERIDSRRLAELKNIGMQMTFLKTLAEREFYRIPIETTSGITNMNLTILRGSGASGKLSVTVWSKQLGNVKAELSLKDQSMKGFISCDNRSGLELLQENAHEIEQTAKEDGLTIKQLDFGMQPKGNDSYSYTNLESETKNASMRSEMERKLYRMAKAMVFMVRAAELAGSEENKVVS